MVAAVLGALGVTLLDLTVAVADDLRGEPAARSRAPTVRASLTLVA